MRNLVDELNDLCPLDHVQPHPPCTTCEAAARMAALERIRERVLFESDECHASDLFMFEGAHEYGTCGGCSWCLALGVPEGMLLDGPEVKAKYDAAVAKRENTASPMACPECGGTKARRSLLDAEGQRRWCENAWHTPNTASEKAKDGERG